jgi:trimeric autotransporter adhesin
MGCARVIGAPGFRQVTVAAALVSAAVLAGAGVAAATPTQHGPIQPGPAHPPGAAGTISTVAGGVGGPGEGPKVGLNTPCGLAASRTNIYISSDGSVRKLAQHDGYLTTLAGTGAAGPLGTGGAATGASLAACGLAVDHTGNVVVADTGNNLIRVVAHESGTFYGQAMAAGDIYTVAGGGTGGNPGNGGPATSATLSSPGAVAVDHHGNLVIADTDFNEIQVVTDRYGTFYGHKMRRGYIYDVAGNGNDGSTGDGGPATAAELDMPGSVSVDSAGNLVIADTDNNRIRVVAGSTGSFYGQAMTAGDIYTVAGTGTHGYFGTGIPATSAGVVLPDAVALDHAGNLVIANTKQNRIQVVAVSKGTFYRQAMIAGDIYTVAGTGKEGFSGDSGPALAAEMYNPLGIATDHAGDLLVSSYNNVVRMVPAANGTLYGHAVKAGNIYRVAGDGRAGFSGDGGPAVKAELGGLPIGIGTDAGGDLLIPDRNNERVRMVPAASGTYFGQAMTVGDIYTVAGDGTQGYTGDGGPATSAELSFPRSVTADAAGNIVFADDGNDAIRVVAATSGTFYGQAMTAGDIYTVAGDGVAGYTGNGGPATSAELDEPGGVAVDAAGNLVIADGGNDVVRVVAATSGTFYGQAMTAGDIYTVAGDGARGYAGDGGPATDAELDNPAAVATDSAGNLVIADEGNNRVRMMAVTSGTFYGQEMTAGYIYTVAGDGTAGYAGDGGPGTSAELASPPDVAVIGSALLIADKVNNRIREVTG